MKFQRIAALGLVFLWIFLAAMTSALGESAQTPEAPAIPEMMLFHDTITWGMTYKEVASGAKKAKLGKNYSGSREVLLYKKVPFGEETVAEAYFSFLERDSLEIVIYDFAPVSVKKPEAIQEQFDQLFAYLSGLYGESGSMLSKTGSWWLEHTSVDLSIETNEKGNQFCRIFFMGFVE